MMVCSREDGWHLELHHAHVGGLLVDCPSELYGPMTFDELEDVVASVTALMRSAPAP